MSIKLSTTYEHGNCASDLEFLSNKLEPLKLIKGVASRNIGNAKKQIKELSVSNELGKNSAEKDIQDLPKIKPDNLKYNLMINTWKQMSVFLANAIGPFVIKNYHE